MSIILSRRSCKLLNISQQGCYEPDYCSSHSAFIACLTVLVFAEVIVGPDSAVTRSGLAFGVFKNIPNRAKSRVGLCFRGGASLRILRYNSSSFHERTRDQC